MEDRYESMLPRLAELAKRRPGLYRARVLALAALGYAAILGVLLALCVLLLLVVVMGANGGSLAALKLAVPLLLFIGILVEALWIEIAPPKGIVLTRAEAPELWAEIERVRRELRAPAPYQVLIDGDLNASVQQVPRLGFLGFYRTYLTIGLPLAALLTRDEFRAVLAHEFGHVSRRHGRLAVWIYRVRATWAQVLEQLEESRHWTRGVFRVFLRWYAPFLDAYTAVLRRAHEFDADREAARVAGKDAAAAVLCRVEVLGRYLDRVFWPAVFEEAKESPRAPADVFHRMLGAGAEAARHADAAPWLEEASAQATEPWDSHPSLAERLASLQAAPVLPALAGPSGAEAFLGARTEKLAERLSRRWADDTQFSWRKAHDEHRRMTEHLSALDAAASERPLPAEEARQRILLTVELRGETVAMPLMRDFVDAGEDDPIVRFLLGRALLAEGDEAGLGHLERVMELDVDATPSVCALAAGFLEERGRGGDARTFLRRSEEYVATMAQARDERAADNLSPADHFLPHGFPEESVRALVAHLASLHSVKRALLVRKEVRIRPETPCYVLAIEAASPQEGYSEVDQRRMQAVTLPGTLIWLDLGSASRGLRRAVAKVPGAEVFRRDALVRNAAGR